MSHIVWTASRLASLLGEGDIVYIADDDQHADGIAAALAALCPANPIVYLPSSDALPGDVAPASPANIGARVAALRSLHRTRNEKDRPPLALVLSGEAAAHRYPKPDAFALAPPKLAAGDPLAPEQFAAMLEDIGYFADDRVDEPGEMAIRGDVIDIFPADAGLPARIDIANGVISAIRSYDPLTQLTLTELDCLEIGRASEPALQDGTPILAHLAAGTIVFSDKAERRRQRYLRLARDAGKGQQGANGAAKEAEWNAALELWSVVDLGAPADVTPPFAQLRSPLAALEKFARPFLDKGYRFILAGSSRDLRFLRGKVAKRLGCELTPVPSWQEINALKPGAAAAIAMPADQGFADGQTVWVAASDLLGSRALVGDAPAATGMPAGLPGSADLRTGDVIIHEDHGVGVVVGLEPAPDSAGQGTELIALEYAGGARRLVSPDQADRIWRYGGDADAVNYVRPTGFGSIDFGFSGTYELSRKSEAFAGAPTVDMLATDNSRFRSSATVGANVGDHLRGQLTWNHTQGYALAPVATFNFQNRVDSFNVFNLYLRYDVQGERMFKDLAFTLNVNNLFNTDPPLLQGFSLASQGFANGNTIGRMVQLGINKKF